MISLEHYRIFYYVAACQSISKAAAALYISQPAVSKTIQKLEEEMNCRLFTRTAHGSVLTAEGAVLFSHVSRALNEFETGEEKIRRMDGSKLQEIRIGATESALYTVLTPALSRFRAENPQVFFHIKGASTSDLMRMLEEEEIDIALGVTPIPKEFSFPVYELSDVKDVFFAHNDYPVDDSLPLTAALIVSLPVVSVKPESSAGKYIISFFQELGLQYSPSFTVETSTNVLPFVENRLAVGLAPAWVLENSSVSNQLRILNTDFSIPPRKIFLSYGDQRRLTPVCIRFISEIRKAAAGNQA